MIISKTRSNIGWEIENQYEILSHLIDDIAEHYQDEALALEKEVDEIYNKYANSDYETLSNETQGLDEVLDKPYYLCYEARKILFCAIFSYFESMLYGIIEFYKIPRAKANQPGQLIDIICKEYEKRFSDPLALSEILKNFICYNYRPLRNYYMHGKIDKDMDLLIAFAKSDDSINDSWCSNYEIMDNDFLRNALNNIKDFLIGIDEAYSAKMCDNKQTI